MCQIHDLLSCLGSKGLGRFGKVNEIDGTDRRQRFNITLEFAPPYLQITMRPVKLVADVKVRPDWRVWPGTGYRPEKENPHATLRVSQRYVAQSVAHPAIHGKKLLPTPGIFLLGPAIYRT